MWNVVAVGGGVNTSSAGQPLANSHYDCHMVMWHLVPALVGQFYDAPSGTLRFVPKLPAPFELPVLVLGTALTLSARAGGGCELRLLTARPCGSPASRWAAPRRQGCLGCCPRATRCSGSSERARRSQIAPISHKCGC